MSNDAPFIRPVPQRFPGTALSGTQTNLLGSLSFPAAGGVQAVDALGAVLPLSSATGSLIPSQDNQNDLGSAALRWRAGYFGTSVQTPLLNTQVGGLPTSVLALAAAASAVNIVTVTSADIGNTPSIAATGNDGNIGLSIAAKGTGAVTVTGSELRAPDTSIGANLSIIDVGGSTKIGAKTAGGGIRLVPQTTGAVALQGSGAANIVAVDTTGGASRLGFFNVTPLIRQTVADCVPAVDGTSAGTQLNALLAALRLFGLFTP